MAPTWEERLLTDAEVGVEWFGVRDWKPGAALRDWAAKNSAVTLYVIDSGALHVTANGALWKIQTGEALFIPPGTHRESLTTPGGARWYSLGLTIHGRGQLPLTHLLGEMHHWKPAPNVVSWLQIMADTWTNSGGHPLVQNRFPAHTGAILIANGLAKAILGTCWDTLNTNRLLPTDPNRVPRWLWDTLQRIHNEPHRTLVELTESAGVRAATLRRGFQRYLRQSPQQYLVEQRLLLAKSYLETTEESTLTIAGRVGFESLSHFTRLFAERFAETPARYRRSNRTGQV